MLEEARKIRDDEAAARLALQSRFQSAIQVRLVSAQATRPLHGT